MHACISNLEWTIATGLDAGETFSRFQSSKAEHCGQRRLPAGAMKIARPEPVAGRFPSLSCRDSETAYRRGASCSGRANHLGSVNDQHAPLSLIFILVNACHRARQQGIAIDRCEFGVAPKPGPGRSRPYICLHGWCCPLGAYLLGRIAHRGSSPSQDAAIYLGQSPYFVEGFIAGFDGENRPESGALELQNGVGAGRMVWAILREEGAPWH